MITSCLLLLASAPLPEVLEVGPGEAYPSIFAAAGAASDGDVILVHPAPAPYGFFGVFSKSLDVIAAAPGVVVDGQVRIQGLAAHQRVTLSGIGIVNTAWDGGEGYGLTIAGNDGAVRLQDVQVSGVVFPGIGMSSLGRLGARVLDSADVVFTRCELYGPPGACYTVEPGWSGCAPPKTALEIERSVVSLEDSTTHMIGDPYDDQLCQLHGNDGITCLDSELTVRGCRLAGGDRGWAWGCSFDGGNGSGGDCIECTGTNRVTVMDTVFHPGWGTGWPDAPGVGIDGSFTRTDYAGTAPRALAPTWVTEGTGATFHFHQPPATRVDLLVSTNTGRTSLPALSGPLLVEAPFLRGRYIAGTADAAGDLSWTWTAPMIPGLDAVTVFVQSAASDPATNRITLGPLRAVTILSQGT